MKKQQNPIPVTPTTLAAVKPVRRIGSFSVFFCTLFFSAVMFIANGQVYTATLSGPNEAPPNASPGTGTAKVTITGNNMTVEANFAGLTGNSTVAHIHAATAMPLTGTVGVATPTPTFPGFPAGVTSGTYVNTFDMMLSSSYNAAYVTANGGTAAAAFTALKAALNAGKSYFNLHSSAFPGGEIRGFLQPTLIEGFDVVVPTGWSVQNKSTTIGTVGWFQGNNAVFPALSGAPNSYAGVNFNSTTGANTISNWMLTPVLSVTNGAIVKFWARTVPQPVFPDRLQLRLSTAGSSTNLGTSATDVGDFTTLLVDVNPTLSTTGFPNSWTQFTATISGVTGTVNGRLAFRYFVTNGGPAGDNSDYIGIDSFEYASVVIPSTPTCGAVTDRIYVDASAAPGGTGSSWACAIQQLSSAITMANANMAIKSIWVADGTYKPTTGTDRTISMTTLRADLKILGGFAGGEANEADANPAVNASIISGDIGVPNDMSDNSYRLLNIGGRAANPNGLVIDGFIFERANADAPGDGDRSVGPAIHSYLVSTATPVNIRRTIFRNNYGRATGAIFLHQTNVTFDNCRFLGNTTNGSGGGVLVYQASPVFNSCVFAANTATNSGGGFYGNYGTASFSKTTFSGNSAGVGGGVYLNRYTGTITNSVFNANTSVSGGGALFVHNAAVSRVLNSTFYANTAASSGGAIVLTEANSSVTAENNIFYKNTANGMATGAGSDITNFTGGSNVYANNILQMNTSVPADNGTTRRFNKRGVNPLFTNEMNPIGADVMWGTADDGLQLQNCQSPNVANTNVAIIPPACSPAINAGDNAPVIAAGLTTDVRNNPRIACSIVDMGAYENQNCAVPVIAEQQVMIAAQIMSSPKGATGVVANPFYNDLQIRYAGTERASVVVFAESGKMIWSKNNIAEGITHADAGNWARGMYQVVIITANGKRLNFKVVKL